MRLKGEKKFTQGRKEGLLSRRSAEGLGLYPFSNRRKKNEWGKKNRGGEPSQNSRGEKRKRWLNCFVPKKKEGIR